MGVRVSVIGAGWYAAENHIPALAARGDVELDGVCRLGREELERVKAHFGFAFASEDHREVLARKPEAVIVASPHHLHYVHARDAIAAGCHVLCEKPMTLDPAEAWDLVARAKAAERHLLIANGYHYLPKLNRVADLVAGGVLGRIEHLACNFVSATRRVFEGDLGLSRWQTSFFRPDPATWQDPAQGGGFAYGQLSHSIALTLWIAGLKPSAVSAQTGPKGADLFDAATVSFEGGAIGTFAGAAGMPEGQRAILTLQLTGSEGALDLAVHRDHVAIHRHDGAAHAVDFAPGDLIYRCDGPVNALVDLAQGRGENLSPGAVGAATVDVIEAIQRSARSGGATAAIASRSPALARAS
jgi:predicted dehydrogenase